MELRAFKLSLGLVFVVSLASLGAIVVFINPFKASAANLALFSVVVCLLVVSSFGWLGVWLRRKYLSPHNFNRILIIAFREAALLATLVLAFLWLSHFRLFKVWIAVPLAGLMVGVEYCFLVKFRHKSKEHYE